MNEVEIKKYVKYERNSPPKKNKINILKYKNEKRRKKEAFNVCQDEPLFARAIYLNRDI